MQLNPKIFGRRIEDLSNKEALNTMAIKMLMKNTLVDGLLLIKFKPWF
jgi:hypothetical protein